MTYTLEAMRDLFPQKFDTSNRTCWVVNYTPNEDGSRRFLLDLRNTRVVFNLKAENGPGDNPDTGETADWNVWEHQTSWLGYAMLGRPSGRHESGQYMLHALPQDRSAPADSKPCDVTALARHLGTFNLFGTVFDGALIAQGAMLTDATTALTVNTPFPLPPGVRLTVDGHGLGLFCRIVKMFLDAEGSVTASLGAIRTGASAMWRLRVETPDGAWAVLEMVEGTSPALEAILRLYEAAPALLPVSATVPAHTLWARVPKKATEIGLRVDEGLSLTRPEDPEAPPVNLRSTTVGIGFAAVPVRPLGHALRLMGGNIVLMMGQPGCPVLAVSCTEPLSALIAPRVPYEVWQPLQAN
jgi:hypothetical protein